jgi:hypothetical protein
MTPISGFKSTQNGHDRFSSIIEDNTIPTDTSIDVNNSGVMYTDESVISKATSKNASANKNSSRVNPMPDLSKKQNKYNSSNKYNKFR